MKRRIVVVLAVVLLLVSTVGAFAFEQKSKTYPWMASFDKTGQLNLYVAGGFYLYGFALGVGPEVILGNFDISGIPLEWGLTAQGVFGFGSFAGFGSWVDWGVAPMITLHWGIDLGGPLKFDWWGGVGLGLYGTTGTYTFSSAGPFFGFAGTGGVSWQFSQNFALILDSEYVGWTGIYGVGIKSNL